jgi:hypothetical protein
VDTDALGAIRLKKCDCVVERQPDPQVLAPHRMAAAQEMIGLDDQRKGFRQHGRIDDFDPRPTIRDVANQAIDAATRAKGQGALL